MRSTPSEEEAGITGSDDFLNEKARNAFRRIHFRV